ncbi:MAG TPA: alpha/beta hydrolase [Pseudonocardiaceae bacterium]|jgi:pimeloyl-ACP methyl ester carboxylesterase|nr:alpha/beta hydrolase [Pseudonocardiaceae bacterium]
MAWRDGVVEFGGEGPGFLLLHGLMGRARTWWRVAGWLAGHGRVVGWDARAHGRNPHRGPAVTEEFVADAARVIRELDLGPAVLLGHSMGGLHAWALAARHPELVRAIVIEDMAPDQRGRTAELWRPYFDSWPTPFVSLGAVREFFGSQGDYFVECFTEHPDGYRLTADLAALYEIAEEWGRREYWSLVERVRCPALVLEAEHSLMPPGQQAELAARIPGGGRHLVVPGAGHVVHDDAPARYRAAVEEFLGSLAEG